MIGSRKIYPRNATARSHTWIAGNPVTTRPESGVDNCYPGLEFDQRNLDKRFFPGLEIELHAAAVVRSIDRGRLPDLGALLNETDFTAGVVVFAVHGTFGEARDKETVHTVDLLPFGGLGHWRIIHDLEPGPVVLGLRPLSDSSPIDVVRPEFNAYIASGSAEPVVRRHPNGQFRIAFVSGQRADVLTADGVIDPAIYEPGDLTRSLCSPWQYDFALCGCFYWASNKPDMVQKAEDSPRFSNFQRTNRDDPPVPITNYSDWEGTTARERGAVISEPGMIDNWEALPAVLGGVERSEIPLAVVARLPDSDVLDRPRVIAALRDLATVEHGLMVEYLYAFYSVDQAPPGISETEHERLRSAADAILSVAIDEMRHLRWVNEMLLALGEPREIGRFIAMPDADGDGRVLDHVFSLEPLTAERLDWFIQVEAPSADIDLSSDADTVDGMYTRVLLSISQSNEFTQDEKNRLLYRIKLIIDEGYEHYQRFMRVRNVLGGLDHARFIRLPANPVPVQPADPAHVFEALADTAYAQVLKLLEGLFTPSRMGKVDALVVAAREAMYNLDEAARTAAANGGSPLFSLPRPVVAFSATRMQALNLGSLASLVEQELAPELDTALEKVRGTPEGDALASSMMGRLHRSQMRFAAFE